MVRAQGRLDSIESRAGVEQHFAAAVPTDESPRGLGRGVGRDRQRARFLVVAPSTRYGAIVRSNRRAALFRTT